MTTPITRQEFLAQRVSNEPRNVTLPSGMVVRLRQVSAKTHREYQLSLRDENGNRDPDRASRADELLVATFVLDGESNEPMVTVDEVMEGLLDDMQWVPVAEIANHLSGEIYGKLPTDEAREKNSSATDSTAPS